MVGVEGLVAMVKADPDASKTKLGGHDRPTPTIREYLAVATCSSAPCESVLSGLFIDDRFLRHGKALRQQVVGEIENIAAYPDLLWSRLSFAVGGNSTWLSVRHTRTYGACVGAGS